MANICSNYVSISGDEEKVQEFVEYVESIDSEGKENHFDFTKIIPLNGGTANEATEKWGCNCIADATERQGYEDGDCWCDWYFATKWNPPYKIYEFLSDKFPDVHIVWRYEEPGGDLFGYLNKDGASHVYMFMGCFSDDNEPDIALFEDGSEAMAHLNKEVERYCKDYNMDKEKDVTVGPESWHFESKDHQMTFYVRRMEVK